MLLIVGFPVVFQQTPRVITAEPPLEVTFPPNIAPIEVIFVAPVVVNAGTSPFKQRIEKP